MKKILVSILLFIIILNNYAFSKIENEDIKNFLNNVSKEFNKINNSKNSKLEKDVEYKKYTTEIIDSYWISRFILGSHWKDLDKNQRKEFHNLYKEYLILNYMSKLQEFSFKLVINKIEKIKDNVYMINCTVKDNKNRDININFRLSTKDDKMLITDIIPEGISFIGTQRTEIDSAINRLSYNDFIIDLKNKIKNLKK